MSDVQIVEQGRERKYFTMLPNMVMIQGLSPFAIALYCRIRWRAGEDGVCFENTRNLAAGCKMSAAQVSRAKKELESAGLVHITTHPGKHGGRAYHVITIVDIWLENMRLCSPGESVPSFPQKLASFPQKPNKNPLNSLDENQAEGEPVDGDCMGSLNDCPDKEQTRRSAYLLPAREKHPRGREFNAAKVDEFKELRKHPAIMSVKQVTGYYPRRSRLVYNKLIETLGENPDIPKMERCFATWTLKGYNPTNLEWVFDWYGNDMYYVINKIKAGE